MVPDIIFFLAPTAVAGAAALAHLWFTRDDTRDWRFERGLKRLARTSMRSVRDGQLCRVAGVLSYSGPPLAAPFSARECAYYCVRVEEKLKLVGPYQPGTILREEQCRDFFLCDEDGTRALVCSDAVRVRVTNEAEFVRDPGYFFESVLEAGQLVTVAGIAKWEPDPDPSAIGGTYREAPRRLRFIGTAKRRLLVSADPDRL